MVHNDWFMPNFKEAIVTLKFMRKVRSGKIWLPKVNELRPKIIAEPPPRKELAIAIVESIELGIRNGRVTGARIDPVRALGKQIKKKLGDSDWLCTMLAYCNPVHRFLARDYGY